MRRLDALLRHERASAWLPYVLIIAAVVTVFADHLFGIATFIGDSDRLNSYLNVRLHEYDGLNAFGRIPLWNELIFAGNPLAGIHWLNPGNDPIPYVLSLFDRSEIFRVLGFISAILTGLACLFAYLYLKDLTRPGMPALAGSIIYGLSVFSLHRAAQVDTAHLTLVLLPLGLLALRKVKTSAMPAYVLLAAVLSLLCVWGFLQEVAYALVYLGAYCLYRAAAALRHGERDFSLPILVFAVAALSALVMAAPRLMTVSADFQQLLRTQSFHYTDHMEIVRLVHEGFLGRFMGEGRALGNGTNLHEGLQIIGSSFVILVVIAGFLMPRSIADLVAAMAFAAVCGVAFTGLLLPYMFGSMLIPGLSRTGAAIIVNLAGASALVLIGAMMVRRGWLAWGVSLFRRYDAAAPPRPRDLTFHMWTLIVVLIGVLVIEARELIYLAFGRIDFTHSRISLLATLAVASLFTIYCEEFRRAAVGDAAPSTCKPGVCAAAFALGLSLALLIHGGLLDRVIDVTGPTLEIASTRLNPVVLAKTALTAIVLIGCGALLWRATVTVPTGASVMIVLFAGFAIGEAMTYGRFKISGDHTWSFPVPFIDNNYLNVSIDQLRPPGDEQVAALRKRLENDEFRSVLVGDATDFPSYNPPHISQLWKLRLLGGYSAGVPNRLALLGWPSGVVSLRTLQFRSPEQLSPALLALLNVKYAVLLDAALYFNLPDETMPTRLRVIENPITPMPRHYLARRIHPLDDPPKIAAIPDAGPPRGLSARAVRQSGILLSWGTIGPTDTQRIEIYRQRIADTKHLPDGADSANDITRHSDPGELAATLGPSAMSWLHPALEPGSAWQYRLRSCSRDACTPMSAPVRSLAAIKELAPPELSKSRIERGDDGQLLLHIAARKDAETLIEGRATSKTRFVELARLAKGQDRAALKTAGAWTSLHLRARSCSDEGCSPHSPERMFVISDKAWPLPEGAADAPIFADHTEDLLTDPLVEEIGGGIEVMDDSGSITADYRGDAIDIVLEPSMQPRFLVVNAQYHPAWRAYADGQEVEVYPTNAVMRGMRLPPGTNAVQLRFEPFSSSAQANVLKVLAFAIFFLGGWLLYRDARS